MESFIDFVSRVIYGTGAEAVITPNHAAFAGGAAPTGLAWLARYVTGSSSMLGVFETWLASNNLPPIYPYDGSNLTEWDPTDIANTGLGLALPANLAPTSLSFATHEDLGRALRDRLVTMQTGGNSVRSADLQDLVKAPYSHRFWGYLKWASLIARRYDGELVDFHPPVLYDRDGTILSAVPFLDLVNDAHWHWHDFSGMHSLAFDGTSPAGTITPSYASPVGQRAHTSGTNTTQYEEEFLRFHRDHIAMFHTWLARTGQPPVRAINMLSVYAGSFGDPANRGWPPGATPGTPSTWVETYNAPWTNNESDVGPPRLFDFTTPAALAGNAMGSYHAEGHNDNGDITHPFRNNYVHRFFAWHQFIDNQWFFRAPRFARWNATTGLRERVFRPVLVTTGAPWPGVNALTIVRDLSAASDAVSPASAVGGISLGSGEGTLRMQFVVRDTYNRLLRARFRVDVFDDAGATGTPVETVNVEHTVGPAGDFAFDTEFTVDFALTSAFRSSDPTRAAAAVGFARSRIRVTGTLAPDDGTDAAFAFEDHVDIDLVQEREAPEIDVYLNLSSFGEDQVASKTAEADGSKRFRNAIIVAVQDRTSRPAAIPWPSTMIPELEGVLARPAPAAGLFDDSAHAPHADLWQPAVDTPINGLRAELASGPTKEDPTLPDNVPQRYTYLYDVVFDAANDAFTGLALGSQQQARLRFTAADRAGNAATTATSITLFRDANPYMIDGDPAWLSQDTRAFRIFEGESLFGVTMTADQPNDFIRDLVAHLNDGTISAATRDGWLSSLPIFSGEDSLEFATTVRNPSDGTVRKIYNFALARIRLQGTTGATKVRAFFRLFTYSASNLVYQENVGYRVHVDGTREVPLLGFAATGEVISFPFFAVPRVAAAVDMKTQPEDGPTNVFDFPTGISAEQIHYFGAYLDINQDGAALPSHRIADATRVDGGFTSGEVQPIRTTIRDAHQCMVVQVRYDGDPTHVTETPFTSDNLAQRNLTILRSDNPGSEITRTVEHSFEADIRRPKRDDRKLAARAVPPPPDALTFVATRRDAERLARQNASPTHPRPHEGGGDDMPMAAAHEGMTMHGHGHAHAPAPAVPPARSFALAFDDVDWRGTGDFVDELMFLWNGLPAASRVELYLPGVRAENVVNLRGLRHAPRDVRIIDEHRLLLVPNGTTYVPLPPSPAGRVNGIVTITLPEGVKFGERWKIDVLQLRGPDHRATGGFQLDVRVEKDLADMAAAELRLLDTLFERRSLMARDDRWRPILDRRVATTRARARAFAERAKLPWHDPTRWVDPKGHAHDLAGPRLRVVVEKIELVETSEDWRECPEEVVFAACVTTTDNGGHRQRTRLPEHGVWKLPVMPPHNVHHLNRTIFVGHAAEDLRIEILGAVRDPEDPDEWIGKFARIFSEPADRWFGDYGPHRGVITPEDVGPWRVWYRIERGGHAPR